MNIFLKIYKRLIIGIKFYIRVFKLRKNLYEIDRKSPFSGALSAKGYACFNISRKSVKLLSNLYDISKNHENEKYRISIEKKHYTAFNEIFKLAEKEVREYLGNKVFLDGINWMVSSKFKSHEKLRKSNSINWHTDNVGARIKMFICIKGDGSQPTLILPNSDRIPTTISWLKSILIESFRWFGIENKVKLIGTKKLIHVEGSVNLLDTQLLHRGSYENARKERILLSLEFSIPEKHAISRGPIGTKYGYNSFKFDKELININSLKNLLDPERVYKKDKFVFYNEK